MCCVVSTFFPEISFVFLFSHCHCYCAPPLGGRHHQACTRVGGNDGGNMMSLLLIFDSISCIVRCSSVCLCCSAFSLCFILVILFFFFLLLLKLFFAFLVCLFVCMFLVYMSQAGCYHCSGFRSQFSWLSVGWKMSCSSFSEYTKQENVTALLIIL